MMRSRRAGLVEGMGKTKKKENESLVEIPEGKKMPFCKSARRCRIIIK
jgi:hypothetical protein